MQEPKYDFVLATSWAGERMCCLEGGLVGPLGQPRRVTCRSGGCGWSMVFRISVFLNFWLIVDNMRGNHAIWGTSWWASDCRLAKCWISILHFVLQLLCILLCILAGIALRLLLPTRLDRMCCIIELCCLMLFGRLSYYKAGILGIEVWWFDALSSPFWSFRLFYRFRLFHDYLRLAPRLLDQTRWRWLRLGCKKPTWNEVVLLELQNSALISFLHGQSHLGHLGTGLRWKKLQTSLCLRRLCPANWRKLRRRHDSAPLVWSGATVEKDPKSTSTSFARSLYILTLAAVEWVGVDNVESWGNPWQTIEHRSFWFLWNAVLKQPQPLKWHNMIQWRMDADGWDSLRACPIVAEVPEKAVCLPGSKIWDGEEGPASQVWLEKRNVGWQQNKFNFARLLCQLIYTARFGHQFCWKFFLKW